MRVTDGPIEKGREERSGREVLAVQCLIAGLTVPRFSAVGRGGLR